MHPSVLDWVKRVLTTEHVSGRDVLEVGSCDVNGSVRPYIESLSPRQYLGVDTGPGPSVDWVVDCEKLSTEIIGWWDVVVSTEMLEHVRDWQTCMEQLVGMVKPGGLLLITTRSPGFGYHPFPEDHWRFTVDEMDDILTFIQLEVLTVEDDPGMGSPGVFALARNPIDRVIANHRAMWDALAIPEGRFDA
jgi:SAM-dependent methyltransferase